jgi:hypothetical protein
MLKFLIILEEQTPKKIRKTLLSQNKFKMAANFKLATKTKFACKNYKLSTKKKKIGAVLVALIPKFYRRKVSAKFKVAPIFNMEIFFGIFI